MLIADRDAVFADLVRQIAEEHGARSICDIGGGANPLLSLDDIERLGLRYLVVDASADQLAEAPTGYDTRTADVGSGAFELEGERFDLAVSQFVAEHVADPASFHADVRDALHPGGRAAHFLPTLPALPFVANRLLRGRESRRVLDILTPEVRAQDGLLGKFAPYYRWCEGPTRRQYQRFASAGFTGGGLPSPGRPHLLPAVSVDPAGFGRGPTSARTLALAGDIDLCRRCASSRAIDRRGDADGSNGPVERTLIQEARGLTHRMQTVCVSG